MQRPTPDALAQTSPLDDPDYARFAWRRYRTILWWMAFASILATIVVIGALRILHGPLTILFIVFTSMGVIGTIMLGAMLMGLAFLSSGSGHDEGIVDPLAGTHPIDD